MQMVSERTSKQGSMATTQTDAAEKAAELLAKIAENRNRAAFSELFRLFAPKLQSYATRQFGNEQTAMDLVQETMTNVWHKAHLFKPDRGSPSAWIFTIARNIRFDLLRKNKNAKMISVLMNSGRFSPSRTIASMTVTHWITMF